MCAAKEEQESWATTIQRAGWKQGSIFRPSEDASSLLSPYLELGPNEWLVVCTQTCSVCAANFDKEPLLEILVGSPLPRYNPKHVDSKGRTSHTLQLPVSGIAGVQALECLLGRRAFVPRKLFRDWKPGSPWLGKEALNAFKGWLAHYYMRIALPDELVTRLRKPEGISSKIASTFAMQRKGRNADEGVVSVYIEWSTDDELPPTRRYGISLVIVCDDDETREFMERELSGLVGRESAPISIEGVILEELVIDTVENITLTDLSGKFRFTEWDELSGWQQRLENMGTIG
ncbi:hypothetical protein [Bradyrhizobium sp.]|uniref:hypothetical protein n=1 Tax=Bradyrhizobium sp. TaxID=376 RepID=UPI002617595E|nr:hypothetical protein [Bradyrhizobium sp.]